MGEAYCTTQSALGSALRWQDEEICSHLLLGFQCDGVDHTDVVGLRGCENVVSVLDEVAGAVVSEVGHSVVEKGDSPETRGDEVN